MKPAKATEWRTTAEVADRYRTKPETVRFWRYTGTGPKWIKVGRQVLYAEEDLLAYEAQLRAEAARSA
jgi:hypothetical protein